MQITSFDQNTNNHNVLSDEKRNRWIAKGRDAGLNACDCGTHDFGYRKLLEEVLLDYAKLNLSDHKIKLLSLGAGELLQDYIILKRFIALGMKEIELTVVDPVSNLNEKLEILKILVSKIDKQKCSISLINYDLMKNCFLSNQMKKYDIIYGIDFERIPYEWEMLFDAQEHLLEKGKLFATCKKTRLTMGNGIFKLQDSAGQEKPWLDHFMKGNSTLLKNQETLKFATNMPEFFPHMHFSSLGALIGKGFRNIQIDFKEDNFDPTNIQELCIIIAQKFPGTTITLQKVSEFKPESYHIIGLTAFNVIDESFLKNEHIKDAMKANGVIFFDFSVAVGEYAISKSGLDAYDYTKRIMEKNNRTKKINQVKQYIKNFGSDKQLFIHEGAPPYCNFFIA